MNLLSGNLTSINPLVSALGTFNKSILIFSSFAVVGVLLAFAFLLVDKDGKLAKSSDQLRSIGTICGVIWVLASFMEIIITLANILGTSIGPAFDATTLRSFITQVDLGKFLFIQFLAALAVAVSIKYLSLIHI